MKWLKFSLIFILLLLITGTIVKAQNFVVRPVGAPEIILMGEDAIDRTHAFWLSNTALNFADTANASGIIDTIKIWTVISTTGCMVGTFYQSNGVGTYTLRDSAFIGVVTAGSELIFGGLNITVVQGDYIGAYSPDGKIEQSASGFGNTYYYAGDGFDGLEHTYTGAAGDAYSLKGIGWVP